MDTSYVDTHPGNDEKATQRSDAAAESKAPHNETEVEEFISEAEEKALVRKIDLWLMPLMFFSYLLQYLDKTTLGYAAILGIIKDTKLVGDQYNWLSSSFYFGYLIASYPASIGFIKFPLGKYLSITIILWGITLACHGAANNFGSLLALRVLLGIFESTISPGFTIITAIWYKPTEHPLRTCIWFAGNAIGAAFGGLLAYAIGHINSSLAPWRWLFIIFGIITTVWGVVLLIFLPDSPMTARWLNPTERAFANRRPQSAQKTFKSKTWKLSQCIEALIDPKTWAVFVFTVLICLPNGGVTSFSSIVIQGFGFSTFTTLLFGIPPAALTLVFLIFSAYISNRFRRTRCYLMAGLNLIGVLGVLLVRLLPTNLKWGRLVGIWLYALFSVSFPLLLSIVASNFAGYTKKTTVGAVLFTGYCAGNIGGPFMFKATEAPTYNSAFSAIIACLCVAVVLILGLRFYMDWENKRRDRKQGVKIEAEPKIKVPVMVSEELLEGAEVDISDWQNKKYRYYL